MSKALAKKETAVVETTQEMMEAFGTPEITSADIVIPKILCMQGLSELVIDGKATFGDLVDSMNGEVIGHIERKPVQFVPFHLEKLWYISKHNGTKYMFDRVEKVTIDNEDRPWEENIDGVMWQNTKCFNFYVLKEGDASIPYIISFKGTSMKAGRTLATQMYVTQRNDRLTQAHKVMELKGVKETNDKGTFAVLKTAVVGNSTAQNIEDAIKWFRTIKTKEVKVDHAEAGAKQQEMF